MNFSATVLVIEDDQQIRRYIGYALKEESFRVLDAPTAQRGLSVLVSEIVDLVLLDLGLPDYDGMDVIRKIREWSQVPIIVVSARDQAREKADALDAGADDYLTKPFSTTELMARIRVALRHLYRETKSKGTNILRTGDLKIDLEKRLVYLREEELHTTPMEYALLSTLFRNAGKVLTSNYIIREVWGNNYGSDTQALRASVVRALLLAFAALFAYGDWRWIPPCRYSCKRENVMPLWNLSTPGKCLMPRKADRWYNNYRKRSAPYATGVGVIFWNRELIRSVFWMPFGARKT